MSDIIHIELRDALKRRYDLRRAVKNARSAQTTIPWEVVQREAEKASMDVDTFMATHEVEVLYNHFGGVYMHFVLKE